MGASGSRVAGSGPMATYWAAAAQGQFLLPSCSDCGSRFLPPGMYCPDCGSDSLGWYESNGLGSIYSFTVVERSTDPRVSEQVPFVIALATLDDLSDGSRFFGRLIDVFHEEVHVGQPVRVVLRDIDGTGPLPVLTSLMGQD